MSRVGDHYKVAVVSLAVGSAVAFAIVWVGWIVQSGFLDTGERPRLSVTAILAVCFSLFLLLYAGVGRASTTAALTLLGWWPVLFAIGDWKIGSPIAPGFDDATGSILPRAVAYATILCPLIAAGVAPLIADRVRTGIVFRVGAPIVCGLGFVLVVAGLFRLNRPDPDRYIPSLAIEAKGLEQRAPVSIEGTQVDVIDTHIDYNNCRLEAAMHRPLSGEHIPCMRPVAIARDDANRLWIVTDDDTSYRYAPRGYAALRMGTLDPIALHPRTIKRSLAPPIGWLIGGAIGVLLSLVALALGFLLRRRGGDFETRAFGANATAITITALTCATLLAAGAHGI